MNYNETMNNNIDIINKALSQYIVKFGDEYDTLKDAINYSLLNGGKRIRGILVLEFCKMLGGDINSALPVACAIEMIHCYSLIHDDLPCMDNDDFRRGKPSCHKQFDETTALLAGDALQPLAFHTISCCQLSNDLKVDAIKVLSNCCGMDGMVGGQVMDLQNEGKEISETILTKTHLKKTSELIKAACLLGGICANATKDQLTLCEKYGNYLGLAFQITDDILDVTGTKQQLGKSIGKDANCKKTTYVTIYGLEDSKRKSKENTMYAIEVLDKFKNNQFLTELTLSMVERKN
ncbi:MAG: polyprenyl synthetase family protein [Oscillospiraceae bacterium]